MGEHWTFTLGHTVNFAHFYVITSFDQTVGEQFAG
jgi:hypothetical protein